VSSVGWGKRLHVLGEKPPRDSGKLKSSLGGGYMVPEGVLLTWAELLVRQEGKKEAFRFLKRRGLGRLIEELRKEENAS
jgi:hypothetical protein